MNRPDPPHRDFDGHVERPLLSMTPTERLEWLWSMIELERLAERQGLRRPRRRAEDDWQSRYDAADEPG